MILIVVQKWTKNKLTGGTKMKKSKIIRMPMSFTSDDFSHCVNCMGFVDFLLDKSTDGMPSTVHYGDIQYLERLLFREYDIMREVIESSGGDNDVV